MRIRGKTISLQPNLRFGRETAIARCRNALRQLFVLLYEAEMTAESVVELSWHIDADRGVVQLGPRAAEAVNERELWTQQPSFEFAVDEFATQLKKSKGSEHVATRVKLQRQLFSWIADSAAVAFLSEDVQVEYSWFNQEDYPFSITAAKTADKKVGKSTVLWSNVRKFKKLDSRKTTRRTKSTKRPDYTATGWQRFYFDDGQKRRFWYIHRKGVTQTIVQGKIGSTGTTTTAKRESAQEAKASVQRALDAKLAAGYIAYEPTALRYWKKNRFAISLIKKALLEFEAEQGLRIDAQYRKHILAENGGRFEGDRFVSLPGDPRVKEEVTVVLGLKAGQPAWDLDYCSATFHLPEGHTLVAGTVEGYFLIAPSGAILLPDDSKLDRRDLDDDNKLHLTHLPMFVVAHCFDEFLTRLAKFPNDVNTKKRSRVQSAGQGAEPASTKVLEQARESAACSAYRRFFFDDGQLQKYWHIHTQGKQFTTYYGRYGFRPSDTIKKFESVDEARRASEKIIAQKLRKGYHEVLLDALQLKRPRGSKRATASAIKSLEKQIGGKLPDEYRRFLETQNGGEPTPGFVRIPGAPHISSVDVQYFLGLYPKDDTPRSLRVGLEQSRRLFPKGHLLIAFGNDFFTLSLKWKPGCVWFWDHESDDVYDDHGEDGIDRFRPSAAHLLAHSFDEFLTRVATYSES